MKATPIDRVRGKTHLTDMNAFTKLSEKGQVVVPKASRDRLGWQPGVELEVIESADSVILRPRRNAGTLTVNDAVSRLRGMYRHEGEPVPIEQLSWNPGLDDPDA